MCVVVCRILLGCPHPQGPNVSVSDTIECHVIVDTPARCAVEGCRGGAELVCVWRLCARTGYAYGSAVIKI